MKFTIIFEIHPPSIFGVPENIKTVIPAASGKIKGPPYHARSMTRVGYGTLSRYRSEKDSIDIELNIKSVPATIKDNFATLKVESSKYNEALYASISVIECFLQHLSLGMRRFFSYKLILIVDESDKIYPIPQKYAMHYITMYNLKQLKTEISNAAKFSQVSDPILDKALQYYEHGLFLLKNRVEMADFRSRHFKYLVAAAFLNMWKALTTVIGDPSKEAKDYQSRYKLLGFDYNFFTSQIDDVRKLRNNFDVAHYHIEHDRLEEVQQNLGKFQETVETVLIKYRQHLADGKPSFAKHH